MGLREEQARAAEEAKVAGLIVAYEVRPHDTFGTVLHVALKHEGQEVPPLPGVVVAFDIPAFRRLVNHQLLRGLPMIVDIVTYCPECGVLHLDEGEWRDRPHKTHLCAKCGALWRPNNEQHTRGVEPPFTSRLIEEP